MMKKSVIIILVSLSLLRPIPAKADLFGGDVIVLTKILMNALQQLIQLKRIVDTGRNQFDLVREINRGIHDALNLYETMSPLQDPGLYRELQEAKEALRSIETIYGIASNSPDTRVHQNSDQIASEAISLNNQIYRYSKNIDQIGESIKNHSRRTSPAGASKLTAQSLGVVLHVLNQSLRAQATGLKLQAQTLAIQNKKDKEEVRGIQNSSMTLSQAMKSQNPQFRLPRF